MCPKSPRIDFSTRNSAWNPYVCCILVSPNIMHSSIFFFEEIQSRSRPVVNLLVLEASFVHIRLTLKVRSSHKILKYCMMVVHNERILKQISLGLHAFQDHLQ